MKKLLQIIRRYHKQTILKHKRYQRSHQRRMKALHKFQLDIMIQDEIDCFHVEMLIRSLRSKRNFEKTFFQVYVDMQDYWEHMNFTQRQQQIELVLHSVKDVLPVFEWNGQKIYLPCFDMRFNRIYCNEIAMLDTSGYRKLIRDFKEMIDYKQYGYHRYVHGFTSLQEVYHRDDYDYVLYHPMISKFYIFKDDQYVDCVGLSTKDSIPEAILHMIGKCLLEEDIKELLEVIMMCKLVNKKCYKALVRYVKKKGIL